MLTVRYSAVLVAFSGLSMALFVYLFLNRNGPGLANMPVLIAIGAAYVTVYSLCCFNLLRRCWQASEGPGPGRALNSSRLLLAVAALLLLFLFFDNTVIDYYQPISLFDEVIASLAVSWGLLIVVLAQLLLLARRLDLGLLRATQWLALWALMGLPVMASVESINIWPPAPDVAMQRDVFVGGEDGYAIYRIPALLVLPAASRLASGEVLAQDRLLAFVEARRDGALDTGVIDLVMKSSRDGGDSWSDGQVVCHYQVAGQQGKCGNATPLFDRQTGSLFLAYNLSGIAIDDVQGSVHQALITASADGGASWGEAVLVGQDNLVFGPGHGIQKSLPPKPGRLLIPAYETDHATVLYSDDHGVSWQRSPGLDTGNETELAELSDGRVYMTTRHRAPIGRPPEPNGRLFSISTDGGDSWPNAQTDSQLQTPVCQASVQSYGTDGGLLFSNPRHFRARVRMTVHYSPDNGRSWPQQHLVYPGPAGYSDLGVLSNGDAVVLYERGAMSYSERISLATISQHTLLR